MAISVSIYVDHDCWAGSVFLIKELLTVAGPLARSNPDLRGAQLYEVTLVGPSLKPVHSFTGPAITPERSLRNAPTADVVILPSFYLREGMPPAASKALCDWLRRCSADGACLVGIASGVLLLAAAGLLDGRDATGNMAERRLFAQYFPQMRFAPQHPLVIDGRIISAASIAPAIDACAHLVGRFHGQKAALKFARYTNSARQLSFDPASLNRRSRHAHDDLRVQQAQDYIEEHCTRGITPDDVARHVAMSQRTLARRFQAALGETPVRYILRCRIEYAKQLLARPGTSIQRIAIESGFSEEAVFRRAFRDLCGQSPSAYRTLLAS